MNSKISVIVPIYKVEKYVRQCIDSITAQTYANLEIILVDDGSPDKCGEICDEYAKKDSRVIVIHKENAGLSSARNAGLDIASGAYIGFVDGDDWIETNMYETLHTDLTNHNSDVSCYGRYMAFVDVNIPSYKTTKDILVLNKEDAIKACFAANTIIGMCVWNKLYKKYIFDDIRFPLGKIYEDSYVTFEVFLKAVKTTVNTIPKYYYRQRKSGIVKTLSKEYDPRIMHLIEAWDYHLKVMTERYPPLVDITKERLLSSYLSALKKIVFFKNFKRIPEYKRIVSTVRKNAKAIIKNKNFNRVHKIGTVCVCIHIMLFKWIYILFAKIEQIKGKALFE